MENASSWAEFENQFSETLVAQAIDARFPGLKSKLAEFRNEIDDLKQARDNPFSVPGQLPPTDRSVKRTREVLPAASSTPADNDASDRYVTGVLLANDGEQLIIAKITSIFNI